MKRTLACIIVSTMILSGCQKQNIQNNNSEVEENNTELVTDENTDNKNNTQINEGDNMKKSISLVDDIYELNGKTNIMLSPLSLNMALGLLLEGSTGDSQKALTEYLGKDYSTFAEDYINNRIKEFNYTSEDANEWDSGYNTVLEIANSVWINDELTISDDYKNNTIEKYDAEIDNFSLDNVEESVDKINNWCATKTHNMIPSIITDDNLNSNSSAILINSIYLESGWYEPWDISDDNSDIFTTFDNKETKCNLMRSIFGIYYENDKATAFGAPYINGMTFIGILPKEEGEFKLSDLNIPELLNNKDTSYDNVYARMPKLNFETSASLNEALKVKGLSPIFKETDNLDFCNMTKEEVELFVSNIIQKTKLELDENGTKASAVTAIILETCGIAIQEEIPKNTEVYLDRPFAFLIYDETNNQIVFAGKVVSIDN